jgi:hypothetical protein
MYLPGLQACRLLSSFRLAKGVVVMSKTLTRIAAFLSFAVVPFFADTAGAQETPLYVNCEYRFAVIFPAQHMTRDITYATGAGVSAPARQFYVERGADRFTVTVVKFSGGPAVDEAIVEQAAENIRRRGEVRFQAAANYDPGMPGRQLNIFEPNGRQHRASVYMADRHLVITEANAAAGDFNALQFEQSITLVDGGGIDIDRNVGQEPRRFDCR